MRSIDSPRARLVGADAPLRATSASAACVHPDVPRCVVLTAGLRRTMSRLPEHLRKSLTWDRGMELADHKNVTIDTGLAVYFSSGCGSPGSMTVAGAAFSRRDLAAPHIADDTALRAESLDSGP